MDYYYINQDLSNILLTNLEKLSFDLTKDASLAILSITGLVFSLCYD